MVIIENQAGDWHSLSVSATPSGRLLPLIVRGVTSFLWMQLDRRDFLLYTVRDQGDGVIPGVYILDPEKGDRCRLTTPVLIRQAHQLPRFRDMGEILCSCPGDTVFVSDSTGTTTPYRFRGRTTFTELRGDGLEDCGTVAASGRVADDSPVKRVKSPSGRTIALVDKGEADSTYLRFRDARTGRCHPTVTADVTGWKWTVIGEHEYLIYSVSPIYGSAGIYAYAPDSRIVRKLVSPAPDNMDYFKLINVRNGMITYSYSQDIGSTETRSVTLSGFR